LAFALGVRFERRIPWLAKRRAAALALLAVCAGLAHVDFFSYHRARGPAHLWEFYHYYVGTKYFPELGYEGLYAATALADFEDDRARFRPGQPVRSLETYELRPRQEVVLGAGPVRARFTPERWAQFKRDVAIYRRAAPVPWYTRIPRDHGYNGTPFTTALLGPLARSVPLGPVAFMRVFSHADLLLLFAVTAIVGVTFGATVAWLALFFFFANPLNDYAFVGGAYFRYAYFAALALAVASFVRSRFATSGALAALAGLLSLFPLAFVAALALRDGIATLRGRPHLPHRFYAALAGVLLLGLALGSTQTTPEADNPWLAFARNLERHRGDVSLNQIGLPYLVFYSRAENMTASAEAPGDTTWEQRASARLGERRGMLRILQGVALLGILLFVARVPPVCAWLGGFALLYAIQPLTHYYWAVLCLAPFLGPGVRTGSLGLTAIFGALVLEDLLFAGGALDDHFFRASGVVGAGVVVELIRVALHTGATTGRDPQEAPILSPR
jgi:hypothetical protein